MNQINYSKIAINCNIFNAFIFPIAIIQKLLHLNLFGSGVEILVYIIFLSFESATFFITIITLIDEIRGINNALKSMSEKL